MSRPLQAFDTAAKAFLSFDASCDGYISMAELRAAMHEKGTSRVRLASGITPGHEETWVARRFREMDSRHDNRVSFLEFLFWIQGVSSEQDEEEQEAENGDDRRACIGTPSSTGLT